MAEILALVENMHLDEENLPMQTFVSLTLPYEEGNGPLSTKLLQIEQSVATSTEAAWQVELWEQILADQAQPLAKPLTSLAFESATPLSQYSHVLFELSHGTSQEILDTQLFFRRTKYLVVIAMLSIHRQMNADLETALANVLSSRCAPDYIRLAIHNDAGLFEPALSAIIQKSASSDNTGNAVLRSALTQSLLVLAELRSEYNEAIRHRLFASQTLSDVWWALVKQLPPDQILRNLSETLEKCDGSIQQWWFTSAAESFFADLWSCLVNITEQQKQGRDSTSQRRLLQCLAASFLTIHTSEERSRALVSLLPALFGHCVDGPTARAFIAICMLATGVAGSSQVQQVGEYFGKAMGRSKLCQTYILACLVYSRVEELKDFAQRALGLPEFPLTPQTLQILQKQHTPQVTPNGLMLELQRALQEAPRSSNRDDGSAFPGDEIDCVHLFLQLRLFPDTHTEPHDIVMKFIHEATCPPHPRLLDCLHAWIACVMQSRTRTNGGLSKPQFYQPLMPDEARAIFRNTSWAVANKHLLVPYLSRRQSFSLLADAAASATWYDAMNAYILDPSYIEDVAQHEGHDHLKQLAASTDDKSELQKPDEAVFRCFAPNVWAAISCVYVALQIRSALNGSSFGGMSPFEVQLSDVPIRRAVQVLSVAAQLHLAAADWLQSMLRLVATHCPQQVCPERCFIYEPTQALRCLPSDAQYNGGESQQRGRQCDTYFVFLATVEHSCLHASSFLEHNLFPAIVAGLSGQGDPQGEQLAYLWASCHALHTHPDHFELQTFNLFLQACELPHLHTIPSYDLLAREPFVLFRLPPALLQRPWVLRILFVILRSSMEWTAADTQFALHRHKTAFESLSEAARVRSKLAMTEGVPSDLFLVLRDAVLIRCLTQLNFCIQEAVGSLDDSHHAEYFAVLESQQLVLSALRFYLSIRPDLPEVLLSQGLTWAQARLLFRISPEMRRAAGVVLTSVHNMLQQEHPEEVLFQADAILLYHDEHKLVERLCTTLSSKLVSMVTDILPHYCRQEALQEAIAGVLDTLAARSPLHLIKLRERLSPQILSCLPKHMNLYLHSVLDRLCGEIRAQVLKLAPGETGERFEAEARTNGAGQQTQAQRKRQRS